MHPLLPAHLYKHQCQPPANGVDYYCTYLKQIKKMNKYKPSVLAHSLTFWETLHNSASNHPSAVFNLFIYPGLFTDTASSSDYVKVNSTMTAE